DAAKVMEGEKTKLKLRAQEEIQKRVLRLEEQLRKEGAAELSQREKAIRAEMERELAERSRKLQQELGEMRRKLEAEIERKTAEGAKKETQWQEKLLHRESELLSLRSSLDEARGHLARLEEQKTSTDRERLDAEKSLAAERERVRVLDSSVAENKARLNIEEKKAGVLAGEKEIWERLKRTYEDKLEELGRDVEALKQGLSEADDARETLRAEGVELQETVAKIEGAHARQKETWRRKLDLVRRDAELRIRALEAERGGAGPSSSRSWSERLRALLGKKPVPPRPALSPGPAVQPPGVPDVPPIPNALPKGIGDGAAPRSTPPPDMPPAVPPPEARGGAGEG
ncbi:hypothetical protein ACFL2T_03715, partial [Elusimicrobiota bacterium]